MTSLTIRHMSIAYCRFVDEMITAGALVTVENVRIVNYAAGAKRTPRGRRKQQGRPDDLKEVERRVSV
jgi:hypothetical protein